MFPYPPQQKNLEIEVGTSYSFREQILDTTTKLPRDISGYTAMVEVRENYAKTKVLTSIKPYCTQYEVCFDLYPEDTKDLLWDRGYYKLVVTDGYGTYYTVFEGLVLVK